MFSYLYCGIGNNNLIKVLVSKSRAENNTCRALLFGSNNFYINGVLLRKWEEVSRTHARVCKKILNWKTTYSLLSSSVFIICSWVDCSYFLAKHCLLFIIRRSWQQYLEFIQWRILVSTQFYPIHLGNFLPSWCL